MRKYILSLIEPWWRIWILKTAINEQVAFASTHPVAVVYRIKQKYRHCPETAIKNHQEKFD